MIAENRGMEIKEKEDNHGTGMESVSVCQTCGDTGFKELLVYCSKCGTSPEHRYCLLKLPDRDEEVYRLCGQCDNEFPNIVPTELSGGDMDNVEYGDKQLSDGILGPKDHTQQIPIPAKTVSLQGLKRGPSSSSPCVTEDGDYGHTSLEQKEGQKKRRKLGLDDNDKESEQIFQSDCDGQSAPIIVTSLPNESLASLPLVAPVFSSSDSRAPHGVMKEMQLACTNTSGYQQEETNDTQRIAAKPIIDIVWRGQFRIGNEEYGPLYGHLSNKACEKVFNISELLPPVLYMEKLPRLDAWPNSFKTVPPTDDNIGLYFFPGCASVAKVLHQLLGEVINKDLVLKFVIDKVELLVFSATILPKDHQKFQGEYYLWGVFRAVQVPLLTWKSDCPPESNGVAELNRTSEVSLAKEEVDGSKVFIGQQYPPLPLKHHCPSKSNEAAEENRMAVVALAESKEDYVDCCDEVLPDVIQSSPSAHNASRISRSSKSTGETISREKGREEKIMEENFYSGREELEGDICDDYNISENVDDKREDEEACQYIDLSQNVDDEARLLDLFPLQVEDIGIVGKVGAVEELNLDLGLGCKSAKSRAHYEERSDARSNILLDRLF